MVRDNECLAVRDLLGASGLLCVGIPVMSGIVTGNHLFNVWQQGHWLVAGVDLSLLLIGAGLLHVARALPKSREEKQSRKEKASTEASEPLNVVETGDVVEKGV